MSTVRSNIPATQLPFAPTVRTILTPYSAQYPRHTAPLHPTHRTILTPYSAQVLTAVFQTATTASCPLLGVLVED